MLVLNAGDSSSTLLPTGNSFASGASSLTMLSFHRQGASTLPRGALSEVQEESDRVLAEIAELGVVIGAIPVLRSTTRTTASSQSGPTSRRRLQGRLRCFFRMGGRRREPNAS